MRARTSAVVLAILLLPASVAAQGLSKDQYIRAMERALDEVAARSSPRGRVQMAVNLFFAHEAVIEYTPVDVLTRAVDAFADAGVRRIDLNVGLFPWRDGHQETIGKYDAVVDRIRARGMQLALNPQYSPVKHRVRDVDEWREAALPVFARLAERYKPDVFVVVHEPTTMASRMRATATVAEWRDFAREAARVVKRRSPRTRIGAGGLYGEAEYFDAFVELPEIEVLTVDIYQLIGLRQYNAMVKRAQDRGKPVYVEETWRPPYFRSRGGASLDQLVPKSVGDRTFEQLDIKWLRTLTRYASAVGLESVTPFWMQAFFKYVDGEGDALDPGYNRRVMDAIMRGDRTETYEALRALARDGR